MSAKVKARRMWAEVNQIFTAIPQVFHQRELVHHDGNSFPVFVLAASDYGRAVEQMARATFAAKAERLHLPACWGSVGDGYRDSLRADVKAALKSIGITPTPQRQQQRKQGRK